MPVVHPLPPVWNEHSRVLVLGSFPSVRSREEGFYYAHAQNRFWPMLARVFEQELPRSTEDRRLFALTNRVALWDVIHTCEITGSSDASIRCAIPNDLSTILTGARIERILCNGKRSFELYNRYLYPVTGIAAVLLPSTSPANAAWSLDKLTQAWKAALLSSAQ